MKQNDEAHMYVDRIEVDALAEGLTRTCPLFCFASELAPLRLQCCGDFAER